MTPLTKVIMPCRNNITFHLTVWCSWCLKCYLISFLCWIWQVWARISAPLHNQVNFHLKRENENGVEQKTVATTTIIIITTTARWIRSGTVMSATTTVILTTDLIATGPAHRVKGEGIDRWGTHSQKYHFYFKHKFNIIFRSDSQQYIKRSCQIKCFSFAYNFDHGFLLSKSVIYFNPSVSHLSSGYHLMLEKAFVIIVASVSNLFTSNKQQHLWVSGLLSL